MLWACHKTACRSQRTSDHVLKAATVDCRLILLINTLDQHLDRHPNHHHLISSLLIVGGVSNNSYLVYSQLTVGWDVDGMSIECQPRCQWSVGWILTLDHRYLYCTIQDVCWRLHYLQHGEFVLSSWNWEKTQFSCAPQVTLKESASNRKIGKIEHFKSRDFHCMWIQCTKWEVKDRGLVGKQCFCVSAGQENDVNHQNFVKIMSDTTTVLSLII